MLLAVAVHREVCARGCLVNAHQVNLWCEKAGNSFAEGSPELLGRRGGGQVGETLPTLELFGLQDIAHGFSTPFISTLPLQCRQGRSWLLPFVQKSSLTARLSFCR